MADFGLARPLPNFFETATNAFQMGQQQAMEKERRKALSGYVTDPEGTKNALLGLGDIQSAGQLQNYEQGQQQTQRADQQFAAQQQAAQQKQANDVREWATKSAMGLRALPPEGRVQTYLSQVAPVLKKLGIPDEQIQAAAQNGISDEELDGFMAALGGEPRQFQGVNLGNGGYGSFDPTNNQFKELRAPAQRPAPSGYAWGPDGQSLVKIPGGPADPRQAGALSAARRAPKTGRAGGSRGAGGGPQQFRLIGPQLDPNEGW